MLVLQIASAIASAAFYVGKEGNVDSNVGNVGR